MIRNLCSVCDNPCNQTQTLLKGLKKRLMQKNSRNDEEYHQIKEDQKNSHIQLFSRVIDMVTMKDNSQSFGCQHKKILGQIFRKTRCSQTIFKQICLQILNQIAHKNFQLDTICQQIQTIQQRVLKMRKPQKLQNNRRRIRNKQRKSHMQIHLNKNKQRIKSKNRQICQKNQQLNKPSVKNEEPLLSFPQNLTSGRVLLFPILFQPSDN